MRRLTIAIDGPAGSGKSTVARAVAAQMGYTYIDTGAMYRAAAWRCLRLGVDMDDAAAVAACSGGLVVAFDPSHDGTQRVIADGHDVTTAIRTPEVTRWSSPVSAIPAVRRLLVSQQQALGRAGGVVMEGRDIGTVVFPAAEVKVFLTASDEERARRRALEMAEHGEAADVAEVLAQMRERDHRDSTRADSPLLQADDAIPIVTDGLSVDEVIRRIVEIARTREHAGV